MLVGMNSLPILSRHSSVLEAVRAAGLDLSYNEPLALRDIASLERGSPRHGTKPVTEAYVLDNQGTKEVWYVYECDLKLFNKYEPFFSCIHDGQFQVVAVLDDSVYFGGHVGRDRSALRKLQIFRSDILLTK